MPPRTPNERPLAGSVPMEPNGLDGRKADTPPPAWNGPRTGALLLVPIPVPRATATCAARRAGTQKRIKELPGKAMDVAFLFNAQEHQILHALPVACELSRLRAEIRVTVFVRTEAQLALARRLASYYPGHRLAFERLHEPWPVAALAKTFGNPKALTLWANRARLNPFDALVVPERTTLLLKKMGVTRPLFIHLAHGPGGYDRPDDKRLAAFDLLLMPNVTRLTDIMAAGNAQPGRAAVIGGVKLDLIRRMCASAGRKPLFANGRPTIVYNPHHRAGTTSWTEMGEAVLDRFAAGSDYDLVFAPHIRMFDPPRRYRARFRKYERLDHVRVDLGSNSSIDMSYMLGADIYLGDISSQVLEFIARPRPAIFLNPRRLAWRGDRDFVNWRLGPVVEDMEGLEQALATRDVWQGAYEPVQRRAFAAAFPATDEPAPTLGARAIADFLAEGRVALPA